MLDKLAERDELSVDELLSRHLLNLASAEGDWLAAAIPDFPAALRWPAPAENEESVAKQATHGRA